MPSTFSILSLLELLSIETTQAPKRVGFLYVLSIYSAELFYSSDPSSKRFSFLEFALFFLIRSICTLLLPLASSPVNVLSEESN